MKRIFLSMPILAMVTMIALFSCNKEDVLKHTLDNFKNPKEEVGKLHNEQLKFILENFDYVPQGVSVKKHVEEILNSNESYSSKSKISLESIPDFPKNIETLNLNEWLSMFEISETLKKEISKTFHLFQTAKSLTDILDNIKQKEIDASKKFSGAELDLYYEHLAVAKYTSIFWYPESAGGLNGIKYLNLSPNQSYKTHINWWKVLGVDCVGGLMGGAAGYAGASAISVIMQL